MRSFFFMMKNVKLLKLGYTEKWKDRISWKDRITNDEVYHRIGTVTTLLAIILDDSKDFLDLYYGKTNWKS